MTCNGGALLFIAHYVDVAIGDVQVTALEDEVEPPTLFDLSWEASAMCMRATWRSDEPTRFELTYGLTAALELGSVRGADPLVRHSAVIGGLEPNHLYHFELRDVDFEIEAKFDSPLSLPSSAQGIVVEQDGNNFLRFDFLSSSLGTRIWVGGARHGYVPFRFESRPLALTASAWMRVWREGSLWTVAYSLDGAAWSNAVAFDHALAVERVGVSAGNVEGTAHIGAIDYFFVTLHPIVPEDGMHSSAQPARIIWP
jgi:hypothetical protein